MRKLIFALLVLVMLTACGPTTTSLSPADLGAPADDAHVVTSCVAVYASMPSIVQRKGTILMDDYHATGHLYLVNANTDQQVAVAQGDETIADASISPDRKAFAYKMGDPKTNVWSVVVSDPQGSRVKTIPWQKGYFILGNWINSQQVMLSTDPPLTVFNPYTGAQQGFQYSDFPNFAEDPTANRVALFDSTMDRVVYTSTGGKIAMLDMATKKILGSVPNAAALFPVAAWSPDDKRVAIVGKTALGAQPSDTGDDIFSLTRDGQMTQLTHLTEHYGKLLTINASGLAWSPDGRYIAFWLIYPQHGTEWQLAVHDTTTQKTTAYCIVNKDSSQLSYIHPLAAPIWSPDGKQLMVENRYDQASNHILIVDLAQKIAFPLFDNMYPTGWLASNP